LFVVDDNVNLLQSTFTTVIAVPNGIIVCPGPALVTYKLPTITKLALSTGLTVVAPSQAEGVDGTIFSTTMIVVWFLSWECY